MDDSLVNCDNVSNNMATKNPDSNISSKIMIKSGKNISSKQALLVIPITKFFSNKSYLDKLINILKGESISLRLIDWFVTNYCKKYNIIYNVNDFRKNNDTPIPPIASSFDNFIIVHNNYKGQLKAYSKRNFDPFCRRNRIRFYYDDGKYFITTVGQLNFFKWALENNIIDYIDANLKSIDDDMNNRCDNIIQANTTGKKNVTKINLDNINSNNSGCASGVGNGNGNNNENTKKKPITLPIETQTKTKKNGSMTRKKRQEISVASKSLSFHNVPTTLVFD